MPSFFCPGGALWRLGKHSRHGGARPGLRQVSSRGTLAHPTPQQPEGVAASPFSTGGVYMGPDKPKKNSSTRDRLAEIRPPTEYYTDGNVFIGRDDIPPPNKAESDQKGLAESLKSPGQESRDRYNDTLNPDGTLASIVFFEETFVSSKLSLNASSPLREPNTCRSLTKNNGNLTLNGTAASPAKKISQTTSNTVATSGNKRSTSHVKRRGHYSLNNIPSWVRQRRCLPTLDEVDIDKIDIISLNSLPVNDSLEQSSGNESTRHDSERNLKGGSLSSSKKTKGSVPGPQKTETLVIKNGINSTRDIHVAPNGGSKDVVSSQRLEESRCVLGDLTNTNNATKSLPSRGSKSAFYRFPRRGSGSKRRSKFGKKANNGQMKSATKQITEGVDKADEHTYVNLQYIANIMTESSGKDTQPKDDTYDDLPVTARLKRPDVVQSSSQRSQGMRKVHTDSAMTSQFRTSRKDKDVIQSGRRKSDFISSGYSKLRTEAKGNLDRIEEPNKPSFVPLQTTDFGLSEAKDQKLLGQISTHQDTNRQLSEIERRFVTEKATPRSVQLDSVSSSETGTNSHSTEGDECAAILCSPVYSTKMATKQMASMTHNLRQRHLDGKDSLGDRSEKRNEMPSKHGINDNMNSVPFTETRTLLSNPRFAANLARQARIVRTNSIEEGTGDAEGCGKEIPVSQLEDIQNDHSQRANKPTNLEFRRSLPVLSKRERLDQPDQPQTRSTTNVRAVEARLSQKQKRKIRRTIEGDEILEALIGQHDIVTQSVADKAADEEVERVQKIIQDWNERSKKLISRHESTCYVGTHVHPVPPGSQKDQRVSQATTTKSHQLQSRGTGDSGRMSKEHAEEPNKSNSSPPSNISRRPEHVFAHPGTFRNEMEVRASEDDWTTGQTSSKTGSMTTNNVSHLRPVGSAPSQVIEIYIAVQPHAPVERDECDVVHGEILVVNSAMQRENDWMWVYVPRTERFGYVPAFVARPMELQYPQV